VKILRSGGSEFVTYTLLNSRIVSKQCRNDAVCYSDYVLLQRVFIVHPGSLPAKAALLGGSTFASADYLLSCEGDDLDTHTDNRNNTEDETFTGYFESQGLGSEGSFVLGKVNLCHLVTAVALL